MARTEKSSPLSLSVKTLPSKTSKPIKSSLSAEFVQDSDDSDERTTSTSQKKSSRFEPSELPPKAVPSGSAKSSNRDTKIPKTHKTSNPSRIRSPPKRSETEEESSPQSSTEDESVASLVSQDLTPTLVRSASKSNGPADGESQKTADDTKGLKDPKPLTAKSTKDKTNGRSSVENSDDESSESAGDGSESNTESESGSDMATSPGNSKKRNPQREYMPTQPQHFYEPPSGFEPAEIALAPSSKLSEIFVPSNLKGKEIWQITAPVSVPITLMKEVSIANIQDRASVLSHKSTEYGLTPASNEEQANNQALLLPSAQNYNYRPSKFPVTRILHLQQLVNLPSRQHEIDRPVSRPQTHVKMPRQQPQGLRMRYHPFGASQDSDSDSSEPAATPVAEYRMPQPVTKAPSVRSGKKRKLSPLTDGKINTAALSTKGKKHKSRHERSE